MRKMVILTTWPSGLSKSAYLPSTAWGSLWLGSSLSVYAGSWIGLISIRRSRRTNSKTREKVRLSLRREGISGRTATTITDLGGIFLGSLGVQFLKWLILYSENWCIKFWRRLKRVILQIGEQDEWRPFKEQLESPLPIPLRAGAYHRRLQDSLEPSEATS